MKTQTRNDMFYQIQADFINGNLSEYKRKVRSLGKKNLLLFVIYCFENGSSIRAHEILMALE